MDRKGVLRKTFDVVNPANGEVLATLPDGGHEEAKRAIDAAAAAQEEWGIRPMGFFCAAAFQWVNPKAWRDAEPSVQRRTYLHPLPFRPRQGIRKVIRPSLQ